MTVAAMSMMMNLRVRATLAINKMKHNQVKEKRFLTSILAHKTTRTVWNTCLNAQLLATKSVELSLWRLKQDAITYA
jgi:hypothetical protein